LCIVVGRQGPYGGGEGVVKSQTALHTDFLWFAVPLTENEVTKFVGGGADFAYATTVSRMTGGTPCHRARTIEPQNSITWRPTPTPQPLRLTEREII